MSRLTACCAAPPSTVPRIRLVWTVEFEGPVAFAVEWIDAPNQSIRKRTWRWAVDQLGADALEQMLQPVRGRAA